MPAKKMTVRPSEFGAAYIGADVTELVPEVRSWHLQLDDEIQHDNSRAERWAELILKLADREGTTKIELADLIHDAELIEALKTLAPGCGWAFSLPDTLVKAGA